MPFLRANIDRAIVMTQYDLRGFADPVGMRFDGNTPKTLDALTGNFVGFAAGLGKDGSEPTDDSYVSYWDSSFEQYLAMCQKLAEACDGSEKEAIQLIIQEIVRQSNELKAKVAAGELEQSGYLKPLSKDNRWGNAILALAEVFEVDLESELAEA